jgi:RNA polymerase sigma-70 factor (ECF subfamily)
MLDRLLTETWLLTRDEGSFRLLYRRHATAMWRLALRLTGGNADAAEDIVQDAWLRAVERLPEFRWQSSLRTWLCGFIVNRWREHIRREQLDYQRFTNIESGLSATVEPGAPAASLDLAAAFQALPDPLKEALILYEMEGFKHHEIAAMLGIAEGTSKSRLHDARAALRQFFSAEITRMKN